MIRRTRRMVPGMLASLLLAAPLLATPAHADGRVFTSPDQKQRPLEPRRAAPRQKPLAARRRTSSPPPAQNVAFYDDASRQGVWGQSGGGQGGGGQGGWGQGVWHQSGIASWYGGPRWQGQRTASGARYEQDALTAAHATLPLGSRVRVALEGSGRSVIVTINDRPGTRLRVIDLSRGAASALGMLDRGIARVTLSAP